MYKTCQNYQLFLNIESSWDRLREAQWFVYGMEENYHSADQFRWCLNSFLRALKEVLDLLTMEVQKHPEMIPWFREAKKKLRENYPLLEFLSKQRDVVVHKTMLKPASSGFIGFTRGRGLKLGISLPIDPLEDSQIAILRYIDHAVETKDFLGILYSEEDGSGEYTCVQRAWRLEQYPDELTELAATGWNLMAKITVEVAERLGAKVNKPEIKLGDPNTVRMEIYDPKWIKERINLAKLNISTNR